jgi:hypothetical protein
MLSNSDIDITFDFRTDANGGDPDSTSPTLRMYHKILWNKELPNGVFFSLDDNIENVYLYHSSKLGEFFLSSDAVLPTFAKYKRIAHIIEQVPESEVNEFLYLGYTIGGLMIWPSNKVNGKMTLNGERGFNRKIADRFDLTLECIRKFYLGDVSPLYAALERYDDFFGLFNDFKGFVDFFLLQDLVVDNYSSVRFFIMFDGFNSSPLPKDLAEYIAYKDKTIEFINNRNNRIAKLNSPGVKSTDI